MQRHPRTSASRSSPALEQLTGDHARWLGAVLDVDATPAGGVAIRTTTTPSSSGSDVPTDPCRCVGGTERSSRASPRRPVDLGVGSPQADRGSVTRRAARELPHARSAAGMRELHRRLSAEGGSGRGESRPGGPCPSGSGVAVGASLADEQDLVGAGEAAGWPGRRAGRSGAQPGRRATGDLPVRRGRRSRLAGRRWAVTISRSLDGPGERQRVPARLLSRSSSGP